MMRNVYLQGELGERFGFKHKINATYTQEIIKCINANNPEFKQYLIDCHNNDIAFSVEYQGKLKDQESLLNPLKEGDVTIGIVPAGSKKAVGKILAAVFIVFVVLPALAANASMTLTEYMATVPGRIASGVAINLALTGVYQLLAPDPSVDSDAPENYTFNGQTQNIKAGDPVPILYGELRVPGRPIGIDIKNGNYVNQSSWQDKNGELTPISDDNWQEPNSGV